MKQTRKALSLLLAVLLLASTMLLSAVSVSASGKWEALKAGYDHFTVKETGKNYDKVHLKVGAAVTFDTPLYALTVKIAAIKGAEATVQTVMKQKISDDLFYVSFLDVSNQNGDFVSAKNGVANNKVDLTQIGEGVCYFRFTVRSNIGYEFNNESDYRAYQDKLEYFEQKHAFYFQNVPNIELTGMNLKANTNTITVGTAFKSYSKGVTASGTILYYKAKDAKKWSSKTFAGGKAMTVKKLKAGTVYQFKACIFVKSRSPEDGKTVLTAKGNISKVLNVRTGFASAPEIQSIKASGAKTKKVHVDGYWETDGDWHPGYDYTVTTYKLTVTLKSAPKGMQGIKVTGAHSSGLPLWAKGTGKTFTINASASGNKVGKSVKIGVCTYANAFGADSGHSGYSPAANKTVTVR